MVSLLQLDGGYSLEFAVEEIDAVRAALTARFGVPKVKKHSAFAVYTFGKTKLIFQNEWDDPCLIASTPKGNEMLRAIAIDLDPRPTD